MEEESLQQSRWARFKAKSKDEYQLVVRNVQSYDEVGSYNLTPLNVYVAVSTLVVLVAIIVFFVIAYTPLRQYIPGYGDVVQRQEMTSMETELGELQELVMSQELYIENLKRTIHGEAITVDSLEDRSEVVIAEDLDPLPPSEAEIRLRREMELERIGAAGSEGKLTPSPGSDEVTLAQLFLTVPVNGEISAGFNRPGDHLGVDILAPQNTAIKAARDGVVFLSEFTNTNGNVVGIQHDNDLITFYKHNSKLLKQVGNRVKAGEAIAIIGNTGTQSTGPHLHFEMWYEGQAVDPREYLAF